MIDCIIALPKFTGKPLACGSWFHSHFDNVITQFIIDKRTDALKTDVDLLNFDPNLQVAKKLISLRKINIVNIETKGTTTNNYVWLQYIQ